MAKKNTTTEKNAPTQEVPTQEVPTQEVPTQEVPTQEVPTQEVPTQEVPTQEVITQEVLKYFVFAIPGCETVVTEEEAKKLPPEFKKVFEGTHEDCAKFAGR